MLDTILAALGLNKASVLTGTVGAGVAAMRGQGTACQRLSYFLVGFCIAAWGAGVAVAAFDLPDTPTFQGALGFTFGYLGMAVAEAAMSAAEALNSIDFKQLIKNWIQRKNL